MVFAKERTRLKNLIHKVLDKYGLHTDFSDITDIFGNKGREQMRLSTKKLPSETYYTMRCLLRELDIVKSQIERIEKRMKKVFSKTDEVQLLMSLPGVGFFLAVFIANE
jgi:transposase